MLITYIVPLYNYAEYIADCLDSILAQGLNEDEYEIIVVDDGSTDDSPRIVQKYCDSHNCVRIIRQENHGSGIARNTGLEAASGEYVIFVDADDWLTDQGIGKIKESVLTETSDRPDIIFFGYRNVKAREGSTVETENIDISMRGSLLDYATRYGIMTVCWRTIFRRTILDGYRFNDYPISEDMDYMLNIYGEHPQASVVYVSNVIYNYRQQARSIMHSTDPRQMARAVTAYSRLYTRSRQILEHIYPKHTVETFVMLHIQFAAIIRLLNGKFTIGEYRCLMTVCNKSGMFPITSAPNRAMKMAACLSRSPFMIWVSAPLYRHIFVKYLKS